MPGLRYPAGMNSWAKYGGDHRESLVSGREVGGISRGLEVGRGREVVAPNQCTRGRRGAPQWLQQCREDLRDNFLGTSRHWDGGSGDGLDSGSCNSDNDLQAMVHDFIENDCVDDMDAGDGDGGSPGLSSLSDSLQGLMSKPYSAEERELLTDVQRLLLTANENTDLICDNDGTDCKGTCIKRFVVKHLKIASYNASVCKSTWVNSGSVPGGEYEYIDVSLEAGEHLTDRLIVDISFQAQFEIARPTAQYATALKSLPTVFVGTTSKLEHVLRLMSEAAKASLEQSDMHLPPWRTLDYMRSKWLSKFDRLINSPNSLQWRASTAGRQCGDELRRTRLSLIVETKANSNGLFNLPRGRSSRANLLLQSAA
ncbi:hypothetical protein M758_12G179300 [Ceratodon purpureus]|nr:hypothetical protein M758_12G179300 [Ceratodon purpureus]